jgi:hypothetical protein
MAFSLVWLLLCTVACAVAFCSRSRLPVVAVLGIALVVRVIPVLVFRMPSSAIMAFDLESMRIVAGLLRAGNDVYSETTRYPYLPLHMYVMAVASWLAERWGLSFEMLVKLPAVLADAAIVLVLARWFGERGRADDGRRAALIYALNPLSIAVCAIHGQFDSLPLFFLLLSLVWLSSPASAVLGGAAFGMAILEKPWPAMLIPVTLWGLRGLRLRVRFLAGGATVGIAALGVYFGIFGKGFWTMLDLLGRYGGVVGHWGISLLAQWLCGDSACGIAAWSPLSRRLVLMAAKVGLVGCLVVISFLIRRAPRHRAWTTVILFFYVVTYGWGFHYHMWVLPFLLLAEPPALSALYLGLVTPSIFLIFYAVGGVYWGIGSLGAAGPLVLRWGWIFESLTWVVCIGLAARSFRLARAGVEAG